MEETKTLTCRVKEALVGTIEEAAGHYDGMHAVADLGKAYAAVLEAEAKESAAGISAKLLEEIKNL